MSYCKILKDGKEKGLKFNQMAILEIAARNERNKFIQGTAQYEAYSTASIIYAGLRGNAYAKDIEDDFTWEEVTEWADTISNEDKVLIIEALKSSEKYKETVAYAEQLKEAEKKSKKKLPMRNTKRKA